MKTPFRGGFRKGGTADESMRFRLQPVTLMHRSPEWATDGMVTMLKTGLVMELKNYARTVAPLSKPRRAGTGLWLRSTRAGRQTSGLRPC